MVVFSVISYRRWLEIYKLPVGPRYAFYNIWLGEGSYHYHAANAMSDFLWWRKVNHTAFNWILRTYRYFVHYLPVIWITVDVPNIILKRIDVIVYKNLCHTNYLMWLFKNEVQRKILCMNLRTATSILHNILQFNIYSNVLRFWWILCHFTLAYKPKI